jgi:3,4-dihydroxy 2-butanone 4-phosphate synthase
MPQYTNGTYTNSANGTSPNGAHSSHKENGVNSMVPLHPAFDPISEVIESFGRPFHFPLLDSRTNKARPAQGEFVIVLDSPHRENEADLIISAAHLTTAKNAFLIRHTSGYLCAPLPESLADKLDLPLMLPTSESRDPNKTAYCITVDAVHPDISTGISAHDRALTARTLADPNAKPESFRRPGHLVPLRARDGGVRARRGHTEAGVELCRLAGIEPGVAVIGEMVIDGELDESAEGRRRPEYARSGMMRRDECLKFGRRWGIKVCTIEDLVRYVEATEGRLAVEGEDY